jgi:hypothetical protein
VGAAFLLSLGLNLKIGDWTPYEWLMSWVPGLAQARNVFRFAVFVHLGVALLAVLGLQAMVDLSPKQDSAPKWRRCAPWTAAALVAAAAIGELWPPRQFLSPLPDARKNAAWLRWLSNETAPEAVIACVPFPTGVTVEAYETTAEWMYWGTRHRRRMVNGYSGFFPPGFLQVKAVMAHFPSDASLRALSAAGADYVVVARNPFAPLGGASSSNISAPRLVRVYADDAAQVDIYRLTRPRTD